RRWSPTVASTACADLITEALIVPFGGMVPPFAAAALGITREEACRRAAALTPRRLAATPEEIAEVILFLAGPTSAAINGAVIMADGGVSAVGLSMAGLRLFADEQASA